MLLKLLVTHAIIILEVILMTDKYKELLKEYRRLAKRADQRLVRIENVYSRREGYKELKKYAYRVAMRDIRSWSGEKATRFNTKPPKNTNQLKAKIADIKKFLESASSTMGGVKKVYDKRTATINKKFGTDFSKDELTDFFNSALYKKMDKLYYADTMLETVGVLQANENEIIDAITNKKPIHIQVDDAIVEDAVNHMLRYYKKDIKKLFD